MAESELRRLNLGAGRYPLPVADGWTNLDADPACEPDVVATVPPIPYPDGSAQEVWACHLLEHYSYDDGQALLAECYRVLVPGGRLGVVVPDTREIMRRWLAADGTRWEYPAEQWRCVDDLDDICRMFLYSTVQPSHHLWSYAADTLARALERAGFQVIGEIDRYADPRLGTGRWYQCGVSAVRPC